MSHKHPDRLARRVKRLEDRHRRDLVALKKELMSAILHHAHPEASPMVEPELRRPGGG